MFLVRTIEESGGLNKIDILTYVSKGNINLKVLLPVNCYVNIKWNSYSALTRYLALSSTGGKETNKQTNKSTIAVGSCLGAVDGNYHHYNSIINFSGSL